MKPFYAGLLGGIVTLSIVAVLFLGSVFYCNYHLYAVKIINPARIKSCEKYSQKMQLIADMEKDRILLTPQEYTSNVITYYNTAITFLVALFIVFSIFSFFHFKFITNEQIHKSLEEKLRDSRAVQELIMTTISGKIDEKYLSVEDAEALSNRISSLENDKNSTDEEIDGEVN